MILIALNLTTGLHKISSMQTHWIKKKSWYGSNLCISFCVEMTKQIDLSNESSFLFHGDDADTQAYDDAFNSGVVLLKCDFLHR